MRVHMCDPKYSTRELLQLIKLFSEVDFKKSVAHLYINDKFTEEGKQFPSQ